MENNGNKDSVSVDPQNNGGKNSPDINYFDFILQTIKNPSDILSNESKGYYTYGLINIGIFILLIMFNSLLGSVFYLSRIRWGFDIIFGSFSRGIAYAVAITLVILVFKHFANKQGESYDFTFFIEKLGAVMIIPSILLLLSIPLNIMDATIYNWLSSLAATFLYISVFMISYLFVNRNNLQVASLIFIGFYIVYRLVYLLL